MAKSNGPFMVVFGDEDFLLDRFIAERKELWSKRSVTVCDGGGLTDQDVVQLFEKTDLFEVRPRAIILDNANEVKTTPSKALMHYVADTDPKDLSCVVLAVVRSKSISSMWQDAVKKGVSVEYQRPKPWENDKFLARIDTESGRFGLQFAPGMLELFHRFVKDDLRTASNELSKLSYVVGSDRIVRPEHIAMVTASHVTVVPYEVADAAIDKDPTKAMKLMSLVYRDMGESCLVPVVYALMRQVEQTLVIVSMLERNESTSVIASRLSLNEFVCKKKLPTARKHSTQSLIGQMNKLCKLDAQVKGAAKSKRTLVELALLSVAGLTSMSERESYR